ncbi:unnamed protein product [Pleuronectes platessa]|uniref:Uncharacterized protein n=1 Tax=Pleuronectes platessa TaxID=8262 RepID=A0A9N7Z1G2_PLEPL|nr:unnamed protein product [Pleuronectes platessa]
MKRKKADIASFFRASGKKSAKAKNEDEMEKKQAESEDEEPPESSNLNGPPDVSERLIESRTEESSLRSGPSGSPDSHREDSDSEREEPPTTSGGPSGPPDISKSRTDSPVQPRLKLYPRTLQGDRRRNFQASCSASPGETHACHPKIITGPILATPMEISWLRHCTVTVPPCLQCPSPSPLSFSHIGLFP